MTTSAITAPLERQFGQMPGLSQMRRRAPAAHSVIVLRVRAGARTLTSPSRRSRPPSTPPRPPARPICPPPHLQQNQSGRRPHPDARSDVEDLPLTQVEDLGRHAMAQKISPSRPASAWSASVAVKSPPLACRRTLPPCPTWASPSRTFARLCSKPA